MDNVELEFGEEAGPDDVEMECEEVLAGTAKPIEEMNAAELRQELRSAWLTRDWLVEAHMAHIEGRPCELCGDPLPGDTGEGRAG